MDDKPPELVGLESVTTPPVSPSDTPDALTEQERLVIEIAERTSSKPALRHVYLAEREIASLKRDRDRLIADCGCLQTKLDGLAPRLAATEQAYRDTRASNTLATIMMAVGGGAIGVAGLGAEVSWKIGFATPGIATLVWGVILSVTANWPKRAA